MKGIEQDLLLPDEFKEGADVLVDFYEFGIIRHVVRPSKLSGLSGSGRFEILNQWLAEDDDCVRQRRKGIQQKIGSETVEAVITERPAHAEATTLCRRVSD